MDNPGLPVDNLLDSRHLREGEQFGERLSRVSFAVFTQYRHSGLPRRVEGSPVFALRALVLSSH